jgi:hypothetical protein
MRQKRKGWGTLKYVCGEALERWRTASEGGPYKRMRNPRTDLKIGHYRGQMGYLVRERSKSKVTST